MNIIRMYEVSLTINGQDVWYYPYKINAPFQWEQGSPLLRIPLDSLKTRLPSGTDGVSASQRFQEPDFPVEKIITTSEAIPAESEDLPFGLRLTIQSNVTISPVHFLVECSGPIGVARDGPLGGGVLTMHIFATERNKHEFSYESPPLSPQKPAQVWIFSATRIKCDAIKVQ